MRAFALAVLLLALVVVPSCATSYALAPGETVTVPVTLPDVTELGVALVTVAIPPCLTVADVAGADMKLAAWNAQGGLLKLVVYEPYGRSGTVTLARVTYKAERAGSGRLEYAIDAGTIRYERFYPSLAPDTVTVSSQRLMFSSSSSFAARLALKRLPLRSAR